MPQKFMRVWIVAGALVFCMQSVHAEETASPPPLQPFATYNQFQLLQVYGFPSLRHYQVLADGARASDFTFDLTNHLDMDNTHPNENYLIDGEQMRAALIFRQGLGNNLEWALEVPLLWHSGGFLDDSIDDFHELFGFSRGRRGFVEDDQIRYFYQRNGVTKLDIDSSEKGIGDVRVVLTRQLQNLPVGRGASVSGLLKLPTGDPDKLTGSGSADAAVWFTYGAEPGVGSRWSWLGSLGALYAGDGEVIEDQRRSGAGFGSFTLGWRWSDSVQLKGQVYGHSALYEDTRLEPLGEFALLGIVGLSWRVTPVTNLDFGITEDLHEGASADVSLHFAVRRRI